MIEHPFLLYSLSGSIIVIALGVIWYAPRWGDGFFVPIEAWFKRLASKKRYVILLTATAPLILRIGTLPLLHVPTPAVHDEFSYLLAGDTFAHGRLTNPTHPMWIYLDTFHVNQQPTYMSKYPPAQGAALALGELLGNPWFGVLLSVAFMCAAITWMLQGWFPPVWALLGGLLVVIRFSVFNYWMDSYWGGALAAIGGALVMGAVPRMVHRPRARMAAVLGVGAAILANSRPLEGLIFFLPVAVFLIAWSWKQRHNWRTILFKVGFSLGAVLGLTLVFMGYYNWRVTGKPQQFPYVVNERAHFIRPVLMWQALKPPIGFANPQFDDYYNHEQPAEFELSRTHFANSCWRRIQSFAEFYVGILLPAPLLTLPWWLGDRRLRLMLVQFGLSFIGLLIVVPYSDHYAAPLTTIVFALIVQAFRHLRQCRLSGKHLGIGFTRLLILCALVQVPGHMAKKMLEVRHGIAWENPEMPERAKVAAQLRSVPGKHLVIVHYSQRHLIHQEWVYNAADIDQGKVVWAREIPGLDLTPLLAYFHDRTVWVVDADSIPAHLEQLRAPISNSTAER